MLKHRYEVQEKIGEGNLFTIYRCEDKIEGRSVAVKVLLPQYASNRLFAERMLIEAQAMIGVAHPGIVEVYDTGELDGTYFIITEYVRGVDLKERIRRSAPFPLTTAVEIGIAICDVLDFVHKKGFTHGDLRSANILVTPEGQIKLSDFWVGEAIASVQSIRTMAMMRSIHYMSPEVAESNPATPAGDIYSLGIMLFEILTGSLPFDGDTPIAIALKHAREPIPSLRALNAGIPKELEAVIVKALQKAPTDRYRSAKAMMSDMKAVNESLKLGRPVVWAKPDERKKAEPAPIEHKEEKEEEVGELEAAGPSIVSAIRKTLLIIVLVISAGIGVLLFSVLSRPVDVRVPNLVGKKLEDATRLAENNRLKVNLLTEQPNETYPANVVYFTRPAADLMVKSGRTIDLWVSKGSKYATVPDTVKLTLEDARDRISEAGLNVGEPSQDYSTDIPAGSIIGQSPSPGTKIEREIPVKLIYSLGPKPEETPFADANNYDNTPDTTPAESSSDTARSFDVKFAVPRGSDGQKVEIVVKDDYGENVVYSALGNPGDSVKQTVQGIGDKVTILIYINDKLVREDKKWR